MLKMPDFLIVPICFVIGIAIIFFSITLYGDIESKENLYKFSSSELIDVSFGMNGKYPSINLYGSNECYLSVGSGDNGYEELLQAVRNKNEFTVLYAKERALYSDSQKTYNMPYEIIVGEKTVSSYVSHVRSHNLFCLFLFSFGFFLVISSILHGRKRMKEIGLRT